jgi:hypothetical protein
METFLDVAGVILDVHVDGATVPSKLDARVFVSFDLRANPPVPHPSSQNMSAVPSTNVAKNTAAKHSDLKEKFSGVTDSRRRACVGTAFAHARSGGTSVRTRAMKGVWRIDSAASSSGAMNGGTRTRLRFEEFGGPGFVQGEESRVRAVGRRVKRGGCESAFRGEMGRGVENMSSPTSLC